MNEVKTKYVPVQHNLYTFVTVMAKPKVVSTEGLILPKNVSNYEFAVVEVPSKISNFEVGDIVVYHKSYSGAIELEHEDIGSKYVYLRDDSLIKVEVE